MSCWQTEHTDNAWESIVCRTWQPTAQPTAQPTNQLRNQLRNQPTNQPCCSGRSKMQTRYPNLVQGGVRCETARTLVATWLGVEARHVLLWWTAQTELVESFPQDARELRDDDDAVYQLGAIYFGITNEVDNQDYGMHLATNPLLARFVRQYTQSFFNFGRPASQLITAPLAMSRMDGQV